MSAVQQLNELLGVDQEIERQRQAMSNIEAALADNHLLLQTRWLTEETRAVLTGHEAARKEVEPQVEAAQAKAAQVEEKLYGGTVKSSRELEDLQADLTMLREQQGKHEETLLRALEAQEEAQSALNSLELELQTLETSRAQEEDDLQRELALLQADMAALEGKRSGLAAHVRPAHLQVYTSIRSSRHLQAVARVERGMCQGCRIGLPTRVTQLAKNSEDLVQCPSCSRILYVS